MKFRILSGLDPGDYPSRKIAVAMSGGVDSSTAALLLKEAGFEVVGLTMILWGGDGFAGSKGQCCDMSAVQSARDAAASAGIPHYSVNLREEFENLVVQDFIGAYLSGITPNPCVTCNSLIKWKVLRKKATAIGCELLATGHYARIARWEDGTHSLLRGKDLSKDQSYFLWGVDSVNLKNTVFPLGNMEKSDTRGEARKRKLPQATKSESQEICFIPDNDYSSFLRSRMSEDLPECLKEGSLLSTSGETIGRHRGAACYTIGQRKGLGIAVGKPVYVNSVDISSNTVVVGDESFLFSDRMKVRDICWARDIEPAQEFPCSVRIRHRHDPSKSLVFPEGKNAAVKFDIPQKSVTPGQSAVFYEDDFVLGGGIIS